MEQANSRNMKQKWSCSGHTGICLGDCGPGILFSTMNDENAEVLECMKCLQHFCIKCIGKTPEQYEVMKEPDIMWFCVTCREQVEKAIEVDKKIEEKCREISEMYENRIKILEDKMKDKVGKEEVRIIAREVYEEVGREKNEGDEVRKIAKEVFQEEVRDNTDIKQMAKEAAHDSITETKSELITVATWELNEQKARENNFVIHGPEEPQIRSKEDRAEAEKRVVSEFASLCDVELQVENIVKIHRLGTYDPMEKRPVLVCLNDLEIKKDLFRNYSKVWKVSNEESANVNKDLFIKYKDTSISHDMTKTQREELKQLRTEAKALQEQSQGKYHYRVKGPPWALKVVKIPAK